MQSNFSQQGFEVTCRSLGLARWLQQYTTGITLKLSVAHCTSENGNTKFIKWFHTQKDPYLIVSGIVNRHGRMRHAGPFG